MCIRFASIYQVQLYEDFARSKAKKDVETSLTEEGEGEEGDREEEKKMEAPSTHIFQVQVTCIAQSVSHCVIMCSSVLCGSVSLSIRDIPSPPLSSGPPVPPQGVQPPSPSDVPRPPTILQCTRLPQEDWH